MRRFPGDLPAWKVWPRIGSQWPKFNIESPQARGLVAWWPLVSWSGELYAYDMASGRFRQWPVNGPTTTTGERGDCVSFVSASSQYLRATSAAVTAFPLTMMGWFRSDDATIHQAIVGISSEDDNAYHGWWLFARGATAGDPVAARSYAGSSASEAASTTGYTVGTWHHGTAIFSGANARTAYLDGGNKGTDASAVGTPTSLDNTTIGAVYYWSGAANIVETPVSGQINDVRIYNRVLSDAEVYECYRNPWELYQPVRRVWQVGAPAGNIIPVIMHHRQQQKVV